MGVPCRCQVSPENTQSQKKGRGVECPGLRDKTPPDYGVEMM